MQAGDKLEAALFSLPVDFDGPRFRIDYPIFIDAARGIKISFDVPVSTFVGRARGENLDDDLRCTGKTLALQDVLSPFVAEVDEVRYDAVEVVEDYADAARESANRVGIEVISKNLRQLKQNALVKKTGGCRHVQFPFDLARGGVPVVPASLQDRRW